MLQTAGIGELKMRKNKPDPALLLMGISVLAVGVWVVVKARKAKPSTITSAEEPASSWQPVRSSSAPTPSEQIDIENGKDYIVVVGFSDPSALSDVQKFLQGWSVNWRSVGTTHAVDDRVVGVTFQTTANIYGKKTLLFPKRVTNSSGVYYDLLAVRRAGTA